MIKRNSRNIGKMVDIKDHGEYKNRYGRVIDFRGDFDWGDPWVTVLVYGLNGKPYGGFPFRGSYLTERKMKSK
jgi:hypothetical protein